VAVTLLGGHTLNKAVASFLDGFKITLLLAGAILVASGVVGLLDLQRPRSSAARQRRMTETKINR
jgi:hypothetical protein